MKLRIINQADGYLLELITTSDGMTDSRVADDSNRIIDRYRVTAIEFENFSWQAGQFKGRYEDEKDKG